jgi:hypothetical protein
MGVLSPAGTRTKRGLEAEIDEDGDLLSLSFKAEEVDFWGKKLQQPAATISFLKPLQPAPAGDDVAYRQCIEEVIERLKFVDRLVRLVTDKDAGRLADAAPGVSFFELSSRGCVESIAVHYRKIFELLVYACWTAFEPRMSMSYNASQIKKIHDTLRKKFPDVHGFMVPIFADTKKPIPTDKLAAFDIDELLKAYDFSSKIVHESGPYRDDVDTKEAWITIANWTKRLQMLLSLHRVQLNATEFLFCANRAATGLHVWIDDESASHAPEGALAGNAKLFL